MIFLRSIRSVFAPDPRFLVNGDDLEAAALGKGQQVALLSLTGLIGGRDGVTPSCAVSLCAQATQFRPSVACIIAEAVNANRGCFIIQKYLKQRFSFEKPRLLRDGTRRREKTRAAIASGSR